MGLTKPRAAQIFNLDYKQATRVVTVANITLTGGAPAVIDGVTLVEDDRVLVTAQSTGTQNGLYIVSAVGTGSNGTWVRTSDGNETGEVTKGVNQSVLYMKAVKALQEAMERIEQLETEMAAVKAQLS